MPNYIKIFIGILLLVNLGFGIFLLSRAGVLSIPKSTFTPSKTGYNYNLPINTQDPTISEAGAFFFFDGVVTKVKPEGDVVVLNLNNAEGKSNTNKIEIPLNYKVKMTPRGGTASQTTEIQAKDIQVADNIKVDYNYSFKLNKLSITQVLVTR